uniref:Protein O-GlcNAc transferase n=1 Tax=Rhipicephalus appendiculatus TaxID=34631 RepID=A0A131Z096_RHIAP
MGGMTRLQHQPSLSSIPAVVIRQRARSVCPDAGFAPLSLDSMWSPPKMAEPCVGYLASLPRVVAVEARCPLCWPRPSSLHAHCGGNSSFTMLPRPMRAQRQRACASRPSSFPPPLFPRRERAAAVAKQHMWRLRHPTALSYAALLTACLGCGYYNRPAT